MGGVDASVLERMAKIMSKHTLNDIFSRVLQLVDALMGGVDASVLERMAKIMSYMRPTAAGKKLKRKDKLRLLGLHVAENGTPRASLAAAAPAVHVRICPLL